MNPRIEKTIGEDISTTRHYRPSHRWEDTRKTAQVHKNVRKGVNLLISDDNGTESDEKPLRFNIERFGKYAVSTLNAQYVFLPEDHELTVYANTMLQTLNPATQMKVQVTPEWNESNACALPDGTIVLSSKMIALLKAQEELKACLSHEKMHIERRHIEKMIRVLEQKSPSMKNFIKTLVELTGIRRIAEAESDLGGQHTMDSAGENMYGMISLFYKLRDTFGDEFDTEHGSFTDRIIACLALPGYLHYENLSLELSPIDSNITQLADSLTKKSAIDVFFETKSEDSLYKNIVERDQILKEASPERKMLLLAKLAERVAERKKHLEQSQGIRIHSVEINLAEDQESFNRLKNWFHGYIQSFSGPQELSNRQKVMFTHLIMNLGLEIDTLTSKDKNCGLPYQTKMGQTVSWLLSDFLKGEEHFEELLELMTPELFANIPIYLIAEPKDFLERVLRHGLNTCAFDSENTEKSDPDKYCQYAKLIVQKLKVLYEHQGIEEHLDEKELFLAAIDVYIAALKPEERSDFEIYCSENFPDFSRKISEIVARSVQKDEEKRDPDSKEIEKRVANNPLLQNFILFVEKQQGIIGALTDRQKEFIQELKGSSEWGKTKMDETYSERNMAEFIRMKKEIEEFFFKHHFFPTKETNFHDYYYEFVHGKLENILNDFLRKTSSGEWEKEYWRLLKDVFPDTKESKSLVSIIINTMCKVCSTRLKTKEDWTTFLEALSKNIEKHFGNYELKTQFCQEKEFLNLVWMMKNNLAKGDLGHILSLFFSKFLPYLNGYLEGIGISNVTVFNEIMKSYNFNLNIDDPEDQKILLAISHLIPHPVMLRLHKTVAEKIIHRSDFETGYAFIFKGNEIIAPELITWFINNKVNTPEEMERVQKKTQKVIEAGIPEKHYEKVGKATILEAIFSLVLTKREKKELFQCLVDADPLQKRLKTFLNYISENAEQGGPNKNLAESFYQALFCLNEAEKYVLLKEVLCGKNGLLENQQERVATIQYLLDAFLASDEDVSLSKDIREVLDTLAEVASQEELYLMLAPILVPRILVADTSKPTEWTGIIEDDEIDQLKYDELGRTILKVRELYPEIIPQQPLSNEKISPYDFIYEGTKNQKSPGKRALQLARQLLKNLPQKLSEKLDDIHDQQEGQNKLIAAMVLDRDYPNWKEEVASIGAPLGGGSMATVFPVKMKDGRKLVFKVQNQNVRFWNDIICNLYDRVIDRLIKKNPKYKPLKALVKYMRRWIKFDAGFEGFLEKDHAFQEAHNGVAVDNQYSVVIPTSYPPNTERLLIEDREDGTNLTQWKDLEKSHNIGEVVNGVRTFLERQVENEMVLSDVNPGNVRVRSGEIVSLDRNGYLLLNPDERKLYQEVLKRDPEFGVMYEALIKTIARENPSKTEEEIRAVLEKSLGTLLTNGITEIHDMFIRIPQEMNEREIEVPLSLVLMGKTCITLSNWEKRAEIN